MSLAFKLSIALYCLVVALLMLAGYNYIVAPSFMAHHAAAVQTPWDQVPVLYQGLIRSLMIGAGGAFVSMGLTLIVLATMGLRQRLPWCRWALPALFVVQVSVSRYSDHVLYAATSVGPPHLAVTVAVWLMALAAFVLSLVGWPAPDRSELVR